jgi:hypothetical protein
VTTPGGQFVIEDTYWTEDDYVDAVEQAGLAVITIDGPAGRTLQSENPGGSASSGLCSWNARAAGRVRIQS